MSSREEKESMNQSSDQRSPYTTSKLVDDWLSNLEFWHDPALSSLEISSKRPGPYIDMFQSATYSYSKYHLLGITHYQVPVSQGKVLVAYENWIHFFWNRLRRIGPRYKPLIKEGEEEDKILMAPE